MHLRTYSVLSEQLESIKIEVEIATHRGTPRLIIVGSATKAVLEARERLLAALSHHHLRLKNKRTVVNLAPADLIKRDTSFDLAIAVGLGCLIKTNGVNLDKQIREILKNTAFIGEIALDGSIKSANNPTALVLAARELGFKSVILSRKSERALTPVLNEAITDSLQIHLANDINDAIDHILGTKSLPLLSNFIQESSQTPVPPTTLKMPDNDQWSQINSYDQRFLQIAAAGRHHFLLVGAPGEGKTTMARLLHSLLPPLEDRERIMRLKLFEQSESKRPFRAPHHSATRTALIGGGVPIQPGEISKAHGGVLFLDEITEYSRGTLESLRPPLEDGSVTISRSTTQVQIPADFQLIAAANPCPCGYFQAHFKKCRCRPGEIHRYQASLSGPFLQRLGMYRWIGQHRNKSEISTKVFSIEVIHTVYSRLRQIKKEEIQLSKSAAQLLHAITQNKHLSPRSITSLKAVAHTISVLESSTRINKKNLQEAIGYHPFPSEVFQQKPFASEKMLRSEHRSDKR